MLQSCRRFKNFAQTGMIWRAIPNADRAAKRRTIGDGTRIGEERAVDPKGQA
ncbi:hypothetical protein SBBP2_140036 [Burkholderiales bacterium]|jgi:hypothetical protein|nr:hypothetical protein SBBP2_140036 [Burkholderiales bacterium]